MPWRCLRFRRSPAVSTRTNVASSRRRTVSIESRVVPGTLAVAGEPADDFVEEVARAVAVKGRDRDRIAEPEAMELERLEIAARVVELVREHEHFTTGRAQDLGELLVPRRHACRRI